MDYCEFTENQAHNPNGVDGGGGAIFVLGGSGKIDCNNTTFRNNTSTRYGDSVYCREVDDPNLTVKSNFVNCVFAGDTEGRKHIYGHNGNAVDIIDHLGVIWPGHPLAITMPTAVAYVFAGKRTQQLPSLVQYWIVNLQKIKLNMVVGVTTEDMQLVQ